MLEERLRARIARAGRITFAEFMAIALYDPDAGFYAHPPVGPGRDYVTSPHVSAAFGVLLARQLTEAWDLLGRPEPFAVVELGAGDGTLALQLLEALSPPLDAVVRYVGVEPGAGGREVMRGRGLCAVPRVEEAGAGLVGLVIANEVLDNVPFHLLRRAGERLVERYVELGHEGLRLADGPVSSPDLERLAPPLRPGEEAPVSPLALDLVDRAAATLRRGYLVLVDYAGRGRRAPVHAYRGGRVDDDVLSEPGSRDITAAVDLRGIVEHARRRGLRAWGPVTQRRALLALGIHELEEQARQRQTRSLAGGRGLEALRIFSNRSRLRLLVDPAGLGAHRALCLGVGVTRPLRLVRRDPPPGPIPRREPSPGRSGPQ